VERLYLPILLLALCSPAFGQNSHPTAPLECSELAAGKSVVRKTSPLSIRSGAVQIHASVQLSRPPDNRDAGSCTVVYKLFLTEPGGPPRLLKEFSERATGGVGVEMVGASKNELMIGADFWWAAGDYKGHRPVIYDVNTKSVSLRALDAAITKQLPSCDYFEEFIGVSDSGEAIIRVPKSIYVDEGCPGQGKWLFNVHSGNVQRLKSSE
jgi:hypothetical protein